jgi:hypothetical protein
MTFSRPTSLISETMPSVLETTAGFFGERFSKTSSTRGRPCVMSPPTDATPPAWKVRIVSWVPGSPIACAATVPTASPRSTISCVVRSMP